MLHYATRRPLLLASAMLVSMLAPASLAVAGDAASQPEPILATSEQVEAERTLLSLLDDPDIKAIQAGLRAELAARPIGRTRDGAATLDRAIGCLTNSLIFKELITYNATPRILWVTEDTPRAWNGHLVGCTGTAGDNPDNIYRGFAVSGEDRYEVVGRFDAGHRATQFIVQAGPGEASIAPDFSKPNPEAVVVLKVITDRDLAVAPDGSFRITIGGPGSGPSHIATPPGPVNIGFRDSLADWKQQPARLALHRLDAGAAHPFDRLEVRRRVLGRLGDYVRTWASFPDFWFGGLKPNTFGGPIGREGAWGFVSGLRFSLADDEALAVTISRGRAAYLGFQVVDPWTIAADARNNLTSLNLTQSTPDKDGNFTYVISPHDPGVANWLDTTGLHDGFGVIRWQNLPAGTTKDGLLRSFRIIKLAEAAKLPGVARTTPRQREAQLAQRAKDWANRLK